MKPATKFFVYGGIATAILGPALVAQAVVSGGQGIGTFAGITISDGLPALNNGFQDYDGGSPGMFGGSSPGVQAPPLTSVPGGPTNPAS